MDPNVQVNAYERPFVWGKDVVVFYIMYEEKYFKLKNSSSAFCCKCFLRITEELYIAGSFLCACYSEISDEGSSWDNTQ